MLPYKDVKPVGRLGYLDGLRGVSIALVVLYHAYTAWGGVHWEHDAEIYNQNPILQQLFASGFLGVQLFFMISGFVIYMTLEKTEKISSFAYKRWVRLFPLMLISGVLMAATSSLLLYRPESNTDINGLIRSLSLLPARYSESIWGITGYIDGAWWSLTVEVFFYFIAAVAFYILKDKKLITVTVLYVFYTIMFYFFYNTPFEYFENNHIALAVLEVIYVMKAYHFEHIGWFIIGMIVYKYKQKIDSNNSSRKDLYMFLLKVTALLSALMFFNQEAFSATLFPVVTIIFIMPLFSRRLVQALNNRLLMFLGIISFPLYLIHQNLVTGLANQIYSWNDKMPVELLPIFPIVLAVIIAITLNKIDIYIKPYLNNVARRFKLIQ